MKYFIIRPGIFSLHRLHPSGRIYVYNAGFNLKWKRSSFRKKELSMFTTRISRKQAQREYPAAFHK